MKKLISLFAVFFATILFSSAWAHGHGFTHHDGRYYDDAGRYEGRIDNGRIYDSTGRYSGRIDHNGRRYDSSGRYLGRTDKSGRVYDNSGRYQGRVDSNGRHYDSSGRYLGREDDNGRFYDSTGRYRGQVRWFSHCCHFFKQSLNLLFHLSFLTKMLKLFTISVDNFKQEILLWKWRIPIFFLVIFPKIEKFFGIFSTSVGLLDFRQWLNIAFRAVKRDGR